ncbi:hypothetical protein LCGC14_2026080 [marine sediment metagenome]|uniref:Uncharacterized protein n=1 Tax=marine sediment metagenome TaxID=412755 RepID=A0A0F9EW32_9ZZZZ|nr:hypothetical protein [Actinomycetota bacterium]
MKTSLKDWETPILADAIRTEKKQVKRWFIYMACSIAAFYFMILTSFAVSEAELLSQKIQFAAFVLYPTILLAMTKVALHQHRSCKFSTEMFRRVEKVPYKLSRMAMQLYGDSWAEAAVECHEAHLPSDCPLCGAE